MHPSLSASAMLNAQTWLQWMTCTLSTKVRLNIVCNANFDLDLIVQNFILAQLLFHPGQSLPQQMLRTGWLQSAEQNTNVRIVIAWPWGQGSTQMENCSSRYRNVPASSVMCTTMAALHTDLRSVLKAGICMMLEYSVASGVWCLSLFMGQLLDVELQQNISSRGHSQRHWLFRGCSD